eukprot:CAMPEP_0170615354 /NCGR_PEP_ID=MMETSP0224-20130122/25290_1 /TAXON_ID=285029 /ORGANISM="Togula jolla, Strain CCCM 725" /LENGTH=255 /DNA_ID=CAMNT_0010941075 /DNA_START=132 /DNA_END=899 /DNA_ORIENTATION=-
MALPLSSGLLGLAVALSGVPAVEGIVKELYTTNAICKQRYCVNPVFPGLLQLPDLEKQRWTKYSLADVKNVINFCKDIVDYDPGLPMPNRTADQALLSNDAQESAAEADAKATELYFYHLSAMGLEPWDHTEPMEDSAYPHRGCARSVARMACYTYFTKAYASATSGQEVQYLRPCGSTCNDYVQACNVECCDESVSCTFGQQPGGVAALSVQKGYVDAAAPSLTCTGVAVEGGAFRGSPLVAVAMATAMLLLRM